MVNKIYIANTSISINVVLPEGKNLHLSFCALSNGSSTFSTNDSMIQAAIERHHLFGKLFRLQSVTGIDEKQEKDKATAAAAVNAPEEKESEKTQVKVNDLNEAKDYLAQTFGLSRTQLRSKKSIMETAAAHDIEFTGLEEEE